MQRQSDLCHCWWWGNSNKINWKKKQNPNSSNRCDNNNNIFSGELQFYIYHSSSFHSPTLVHDTAYTKIEDKIISIVAYLEIEADNRKTERIEAEEREKRRKEEERKREEFEEEKRKELEDFKDLLYSAERFRKTNILREYINAFENHAIEDGETDDELLAKIQWAREKADWLDPFIAKKDNYLNSYDMDRILQAAVPERSYRNSGYSFWTKPYWKKNDNRIQIMKSKILLSYNNTYLCIQKCVPKIQTDVERCKAVKTLFKGLTS